MTLSVRPQIDRDAGIFRVPRRAFVDQAVFEKEYSAIFDRVWLYLGHASELPTPGSFLTRTVARRPILFTRDADDQYHAIINSCPHRGAVVCRERQGSAAAFQCVYHGWVFANTGRLKIVPGAKGYPEGYKNDPGKQMSHVARFDRFGDFFFISFAADGEDLPTYLAESGEYLKLLEEQTASKMVVIGGTQEYSIRGNWKLLAENSIDGYHAISTHSTYIDYLKNTNGASNVNGFVGVSHPLSHGHAIIELEAPWGRPVANWVPAMGDERKPEIEALQVELEARLGTEKARRISKLSRNMLIFPNFVVNDIMAITLRTFWPTAPDYMEVNGWAVGPEDESEWLREYRLFNFNEFLGPGGFATPDDVEAIEKCAVGYRAFKEAEYNDLSRGLMRDGPNAYDDEEQMRAFWVEWDRRLMEAEA